ncbi:hypothetical protein [Roseateles sp.]|jgi:hypothetical protein|uniref:hypothetical protein n=1 Tax=Roseateles sp. TaxID=1971397 RepID=UPI0037CC3CC5
MEKVVQQFGFHQVDAVNGSGASPTAAQDQSPIVVPLECLELVSGGNGEANSAPVKGW